MLRRARFGLPSCFMAQPTNNDQALTDLIGSFNFDAPKAADAAQPKPVPIPAPAPKAVLKVPLPPAAPKAAVAVPAGRVKTDPAMKKEPAAKPAIKAKKTD